MNRIYSYIDRNLPRLLLLTALLILFGLGATPASAHGMHGLLLGAPMLMGVADPAPVSPTDVRIVDPVLSNIAVGYQNSEFVGGELFPRVPVPLRGGNVITFGKEAFKLYNARRAPGSRTKRLQFGYSGAPYALVQDALDVPMPREFQQEGENALGLDLGIRATKLGMNSLLLGLENDQATLARNTANYDANHQFDHTAAPWSNNANNPIQDVIVAKEEIRSTIGIYPNVMLVSATTFEALQNNTFITDRFKYTTPGIIGADLLAPLFGLKKIVIGAGVYFDDLGNNFDIWGNDAILAYVPQAITSQEVPSFGYTYTLASSPYVEQPYWDAPEKSWIYGVTFERTPQLTGVTSGFLLKGVGTGE